MATIWLMTEVAINDCTLLPEMAIKKWICHSIENFSHFFAISGNVLHPDSVSTNARQKFIDLKVSKNAWQMNIA